MLGKIKRQLVYILNKLLLRFRLKIAKIDAKGWRNKNLRNLENALIYVGSGSDKREGYVNCDIRALTGIDLVCCAWDLPRFVKDAASIYTRHTLEHLTDGEARHALNRWFEALKVGGTVEIIVPNMRYHIEQWLNADWENEGPVGGKTDARYGFAGFYGWQRECDPVNKPYNQTYWDVHKSGYDEQRMTYLLKQAGFGHVEVEIVDQVHLIGRGTKITQKNERQVAPNLSGIRADHLKRYEMVGKYLMPGMSIGDFACGVGYGSYLFSKSQNDLKIKAVDIDAGAIEYAKQNYQSDSITYTCEDILNLNLKADSLDIIVSFETIEHVDDYERLLEIFYKALKPRGLLFCSTPNEEVIPLAEMKNPFHIRHFTPGQFEHALNDKNYYIRERLTQINREPGDIVRGWNGMYNIAIAEKPQ